MVMSNIVFERDVARLYPRPGLGQACISDMTAIVIFPGIIITMHTRLNNLSGSPEERERSFWTFIENKGVLSIILRVFLFPIRESRSREHI